MNTITVSKSINELLSIESELKFLLTQKGVKLAIIVNKNLTTLRSILKPILDSHSQQYEKIERLQEYQEALKQLYQTYGKKNEDGTLIQKTVNGQTVIEIGDMKAYTAAKEKLEKGYKETIDQIQTLNAEYAEVLESADTAVELEQISADMLSDDIAGEQILSLITAGIIV